MKRIAFGIALLMTMLIPSGVYASRVGSNLSLDITYTEVSEPLEEVKEIQEIQLLATDLSDETDVDKHFGRDALSKLDNGEWLVKFYDAYADCVDKLTEKEVSLLTYDGTLNSFVSFLNANYNRIADAFCYDHPQYVYYLNNDLYSDITIDVNVRYKSGLFPPFTQLPEKLIFTPLVNNEEITEAKKQELKKKQKTAEEAAEKILADANITESMSDYEKSLAVHNILAYNIEYHHEAANAIKAEQTEEEIVDVYKKYPNVHTMYGAVVEHKAVCDGYAKAYQYIMYKLGIPCHIATGYGRSESHAWNIVKLDGDWYYTDLTWDDQDNGIYFSYMNITTEQLERDHYIDESDYPLPVCTAILDSYYTKNSAEPDIDFVASQLSDSIFARVYAPDKSINEIYQWFYDNIYSIMGKLPEGRDGNICSAMGIGGEYHLILARNNGICADKDFNLAIGAEATGNSKLIQIFYDSNDAIIYTNISDIELENSGLKLLNIHPYTKVEGYSKVKYVLWDGVGALRPLGISDSVKY